MAARDTMTSALQRLLKAAGVEVHIQRLPVHPWHRTTVHVCFPRMLETHRPPEAG